MRQSAPTNCPCCLNMLLTRHNFDEPSGAELLASYMSHPQGQPCSWS